MSKLDGVPYDEACNLEPHRPELTPLSVAEGEELAQLERRSETSILSIEDRQRLIGLGDRALLYGQEGVEARPFAGLTPRFAPQIADSGKDDGGLSAYLDSLAGVVDFGYDPSPLTRWQRVRWWFFEIGYRLRTAWGVLRHG